MRLLLIFSMLLASSLTFAKNVGDFNRVLIEGVQKDLKADNAEEMKVSASRGPASVQEEEHKVILPQNDNEKRHRQQFGTSKW